MVTMNYRNAVVGFIILVVVGAIGYQYGPTDPAKKQAEEGREVLYWVAPMDPDYKSDEPGKSPMGMDLEPVYADETESDTAPPLVKLTGRQLVLADVETVPVRQERAVKKIRTTGRATYDERNVESVTAWFPGRIEKLHVDFTGDTIQAGQPLAEIYSPELITAQQEYLSSLGNPNLRESARQKLKYWGITDEQMDRLKRTKSPRSTMTITAPKSGTVIEKTIREGEYVREGTELYRIADYGSLWIKLDVFQQNSPWIRKGQKATVQSPEVPSRKTEGTIEFVDPFYDERLRASQARLTFTDPPDWVVPGKYFVAYFQVPLSDLDVKGLESDTKSRHPVVPKEAVLKTGERDLVYVQYQPGQFTPREVQVGPLARTLDSGAQVYPVIDGVEAGEKVVRSGNFLIDSQSRVGSGGGGFSGALDEDEDDEGGHQH